MSEIKVLEANKLHGGYGPTIKIIHGVDVHVNEAEICILLGPNGSGKSTLVKLIYGLISRHDGTITYRKKENSQFEEFDLTKIHSNKMAKLGIGFVPQSENVFPNLTIEENLEMGGFILDDDELEKAKDRIFDIYPILEERKSMKAKTLSGGQRQMLAMSRALMINPTLIILDEPSAALQPNLVMDVMDRIKALRDNLGVSVLLVEQNAKSGLSIADRGYILAGGKVVYENTGKVLLHETDLASYYLGYASK